MPDLTDPLSAEQKDDIDRAITLGIQLEQEMDKQTGIGIDHTSTRENVRKKIAQLRNMKRLYGNKS